MQDTDLWPAATTTGFATEMAQVSKRLQPKFNELLLAYQLPAELASELPRLYLPLAAWLNRQRAVGTPLLVGLNGSQGSGKSTLCALLKWIFAAAFDCRTCIVSIDDLYLPKSTRQRLAVKVHPLLATRGVPGTHDTMLGIDLLNRLRRAEPGTEINLPRYSKAHDDRLSPTKWASTTTPVDLVLFEGWCVGATPQAEEELQEPINKLEEKEDADSTWRRYVNDQLGGPYRDLFSLIDLQLMLEIPSWEMVYCWRKHQEERLAAEQIGAGIMDEVALQRFIMHYERLTKHQLQTLPGSADLVMALNQKQQVVSIQIKDQN